MPTPFYKAITFSIALFAVALLLGSCSGIRRADTMPSDPSDAPTADGNRSDATAGRSAVLTAARDTLARRFHAAADNGGAPTDSESYRFYERRNYELAWFGEDGTLQNGQALLDRLTEAWRDGLTPAAYLPDTLVRTMDDLRAGTPDPDALSRADLMLTQSFLRYGNDLMTGEIDPGQVHENNYLQAEHGVTDSLLGLAWSEQSPDPFVNAVAPRHPQYELLRQALVRYRDLYERGGWDALPDGPKLERGDHSFVVPALRRRLAASGDLDSTALADTSLVFRGALVGALARFQRRHGLQVDGVLGPSTRDALNVPVTERIRQIERNMERWRWLPEDLGERYVMVNLPEYTMYGYSGDHVDLRMRVIVGLPGEDYRTPVFSDDMDHVVFRPYWNVPSTITKREILPRAREDESFFQRNRYEIVDRGRVMPYSPENLDALEDERMYVRQQPGSYNSLGLVKFMFPNRYNIYIHDTPADHLFSRTRRSLSHGCVRIADPVEFARFVLDGQRDDQGQIWDSDRIVNAMYKDRSSDGQGTIVNLEQPLPVYLMYLTAVVRDTGTIVFLDDMYGYDAALEAARRSAFSDVDAVPVLAQRDAQAPSCATCAGTGR